MTRKSPLQRTQFIMMFFAFAFGMILSSLLSQYGKQKETGEQQKEILFIYRGIEKYMEDVVDEDQKKLAELAKQKQSLVENAALRQHFLERAHHLNQPLEELIKSEMPWQSVTETELVDFYEQNKTLLNKAYPEIYPELKQHLERQRIKQAKQILLNKLIDKGDLAILPEN